MLSTSHPVWCVRLMFRMIHRYDRGMAKAKLKFEGVGDLRFFVSLDVAPVVIGTAGLAALELDLVPENWPLASFIKDYSVFVIVLLVCLVVLPPPIARGISSLRDREAALLRNVEAFAAYRGLASRAANLVGKLRESFDGTVTNQYQNHLLHDCQSYFKSRPMPDGRERPHDFQVEASFYGLTVNRQSKLLERKLFTNTDRSRMRANFSNRSPGEGRIAVDKISTGGYAYCGDVADPEVAGALGIKDGSSRNYRTFLSVPVFRDRKSEGDDRVIGMLSVNVTHRDVIHESDRHILEVYAWFLAVAFQADQLAVENISK